MGDLSNQIQPVSIENEMRQSYLDYAMSVIVGRALPDVRDGLKPVHRRVLYAMGVLNNDWNKPYKKSARVVGDVIGKYHPHGDSAVYDTIVRMAQEFSLRYPLVDGQGNFGSIDGDAAAAMRYTEVRMTKVAHDLSVDLEKETVDFGVNYDGSEIIPEVLPTRIPNLLVNGSSGIAVGMATNIPPHNLREVIDACFELMDNPDVDLDGLMKFISGPDFPTGAIINGRAGIVQAYRTGKGRIYVRAKTHIEENEKTGKASIIVTEVPYQLNKARLVEKIADLVKEKKIEGITELRDESDKDGLRVVIELRRNEIPDVVLNNLYAQTQMQSVFGINTVALVNGQPKLLNLKECLDAFLLHRREVVTRRTVYLLRKAREKAHILEGQAVALANIDPVIALIKSSTSASEARERLITEGWESDDVVSLLGRTGADTCRPEGLPKNYGYRDGKYYLSPEQAQAILDIRLHKLTALEHQKIIDDYQQLIDEIGQYIEILSNTQRLMEIIREELQEVRDNYGDERRTEITSSAHDITVEDLITEEDRVVTISHGGYAKTQPLDAYQAQRRGGKGKAAASLKDEDFVEHLLVANTHDIILCFSNAGKVYWLKVFHIPVASRTSRGRPMVNLLPLDENERVTSILPVKEYTEGHFVFMATANGTVKKTPLVNFSRQRSSGLRALELDDGDTLVGTAITDGEMDVMLVASSGKAIRFKEADVRPMGRTARGVRGIRLAEAARMISLIIPAANGIVLTVSKNGYGKRTMVDDFPVYGRGGQGVISMQTSTRNGEVVGAIQVFDGDEMMLISDKGTLVRTRTDEVSVQGRNTQGVRLIKLREEETLVGVERVEEPEEELDIDNNNGTEISGQEGLAVEYRGEDVVDNAGVNSDGDTGGDDVEDQSTDDVSDDHDND